MPKLFCDGPAPLILGPSPSGGKRGAYSSLASLVLPKSLLKATFSKTGRTTK